MMQLIKQLPIPTAGVALGLAALGNLLLPYSALAHTACGLAATALLLMLVVKIVRFAGVVRNDFRNPIFASVSGTFFMALMQLATYLEPFWHAGAFALWAASLVGHGLLIVWFTAVFIAGFKLSDVYPTYFICYVGIIVGAVTSPSFGMEGLGMALFYGGFFMALMQLATYLEPLWHAGAFALWAASLVGHGLLIVWFTAVFIAGFKLSDVYPTYFICYVGIIVGAVTSPSFGMEGLGMALFYGGFACYLVLLVIVTLRYAKLGVPEGARPLFCIYAAPMSLSLAGYLTVAPEPNVAFALVLATLAQALFFIVLLRLPSLLKLPFYPSYAAMTFPFVITAVALGKVVGLLELQGIVAPTAVLVLLAAETVFATGMVLYVTAHYLGHFRKLWLSGRKAPEMAAAPVAERPGVGELEG